MPGALDITWESPCGKTITSPATRWTAGWSTMPPQHEPAVTTWKSITCSAPGTMRGAISGAAGVSVAQGAEASTLKNTAPVRRTARSTSDSGSLTPIPAAALVRARERQDER